MTHLQEAEPMWRVMKGAGPMCQMLHQWLIHLLVAMKLGEKVVQSQETGNCLKRHQSRMVVICFYNSHLKCFNPTMMEIQWNTIILENCQSLPPFFCKAGLLSNVDCWYYHFEDFEVTTLSLTRKRSSLNVTWFSHHHVKNIEKWLQFTPHCLPFHQGMDMSVFFQM